MRTKTAKTPQDRQLHPYMKYWRHSSAEAWALPIEVIRGDTR